MKKSFKIISLLLVVSMLFAFASCSPKDNEELTTTESTEIGEVVSTTEETTEKTDVLVLGVDASLVPYEYMNGDEVVGINIEIAKAIADELDMELEIQISDDGDNAALRRVEENQCDIVMMSISFLQDSFGRVEFSDVYSHEIQSVVVKATTEYNAYDDFYSGFNDDGAPTGLKEGIKIGVQKGTTAEKYCSKSVSEWGFEKENVVVYSTGAEAIKALDANEITAVVIEDELAKQLIDATSGLKILDSSYIEQSFAIGVAPDKAELLEKINTAIAKLKNDGTIEKIIRECTVGK